MKPTTYLLAALTLLLGLSIRAQEVSQIPAPAETASERMNQSPRHGEYVDVSMGDVKIKTWVVYPEVKENAPVVLVIHEIFGLTDWVRAVADQLAADGFIAVAPDLLSGYGPNGGGTEALGDKVRETIRQIGPEEQAKRLDAIREWAIKLPAASDKTATIGFCWGGSASFNYATRQPKLNAAVVYYGTGPMKEREADKDALAKINCPVLGIYGGNDNRVNATIDATKAAMSELGKQYDPRIYEGAGHGFLRQQGGSDANAKASKEAWPATIEFLKKNLK